MLLPSISVAVAGLGVTALLFIMNWFVWSLPQARRFHVDPKAIFLAGPPTHSDLYRADPVSSNGFKEVA